MDAPSSVVLTAGALGDTVLTLPLVRRLPHRWPGSVRVVARSEYLPVLRCFVGDVHLASLDGPPHATLFAAEPAMVASAAREAVQGVDAVINMADTAGGPLQSNLQRLCQRTLVNLPSRPPEHWDASVAAFYLTSVLGQEAWTLDEPLLQVAPASRMQARANLQHHVQHVGRPLVLLHPGSGGLHKCWSIEAFKQLADDARHADVEPLFLVGYDEVERFGEPFLFQLQGVAPVLGPMSLAEVLPHVAAADAYVGNDAGMTHVAAQLGVPTVALFGPTSATWWQPLGPRVYCVERAELPRITPANVLAAVLDLLATDDAEG